VDRIRVRELRDVMPKGKGAKPPSRGDSKTAWIRAATLRRLRLVATGRDTDLSGAIEWLVDQVPGLRESIERLMSGK